MVYDAINMNTKQKCALKVIMKKRMDMNPDFKNIVETEVRILKATNHIHEIVNLIDVFEDDENHFLVLELIDSISLQNLLLVRKTFTQIEVQFWGLQILKLMKILEGLCV